MIREVVKDSTHILIRFFKYSLNGQNMQKDFINPTFIRHSPQKV
jgi:hypothetical protein